MSDEQTTEPATTGQEAPRTFSQEEVDALMGKVRREVKGQYADYDALKAKASEAEGAAEAVAKAAEADERAAKARAEADATKAELEHVRLVARVSQETGVPASLIHGDTAEDMAASAKAVSDYASRVARPGYPADKGGSTPGGAHVGVSEIEAIKDPVERVRMRAAHSDLYA